jgi:hypothetical protein
VRDAHGPRATSGPRRRPCGRQLAAAAVGGSRVRQVHVQLVSTDRLVAPLGVWRLRVTGEELRNVDLK